MRALVPGISSRPEVTSLEAETQARTVIHPLDAYRIHLDMTGGGEREEDKEGQGERKYPAKHHARRVAAELGATHGLIYLVGQQTVNWEDSDQERSLRQRRYFYYLSGVDEADCSVTYEIQTDRLALYIPNFDLHRAIWNGPTVTKDEAQARYDVDEVFYCASLRANLLRWLREHNNNSPSSPVYVLHDSQKLPDDLQQQQQQQQQKEVFYDVERLQHAMDAARGVKDEYEIELIRHANRISGLAHRKVLERIRHMSNEAEIEGLFLDVCVSHGARNQAYSLIAGSGENAAVLHYVKNNEPLAGRQLVCLDAGAEWNCYASDVTRTFPLTCPGRAGPAAGWPSVQARDIYRLVEQMQEECIKRIRPGVRFLDLHVLAHRIAIEGLLRLGILRNDNGETVEELRQTGVSRVFFPHGLGHHVGLEVHDVSGRELTAAAAAAAAGFSSAVSSSSKMMDQQEQRNYRSPCTLSAPVLEEGMVVTVEPGIYFSRLALMNAQQQQQQLAKYIDFDVARAYIPVGGVRIEDDILVTGKGYENLTTAPKGDAMLEIIGCETEDRPLV